MRHAHRPRPDIHGRPNIGPAARCVAGSKVPGGLRRTGKREERHAAATGGLSQVAARRRHAGCLALGPLGRSLTDLVQLIAQCEQRKIQFESLTEKIEPRSPAGRLVFHVFAALAEFKCNLIRERTSAAARGRGLLPIDPEDVARLSPLVFEHINLLGRYAFSVPESVARGELPPLRDPGEAIQEEFFNSILRLRNGPVSRRSTFYNSVNASLTRTFQKVCGPRTKKF